MSSVVKRRKISHKETAPAAKRSQVKPAAPEEQEESSAEATENSSASEDEQQEDPEEQDPAALEDPVEDVALPKTFKELVGNTRARMTSAGQVRLLTTWLFCRVSTRPFATHANRSDTNPQRLSRPGRFP